jgi:hypothetical protein
MKLKEGESYSQKHGPNAELDPVIRDAVIKHARNKELTCAAAFRISEQLSKSPSEIGRALDLMEFRLIKCQLGLFGYQPQSKIVAPKLPENKAVEQSIRSALQDGKLSCLNAWKIAARHGIPKMAVSAACEAFNLKIKPCQLGAF